MENDAGAAARAAVATALLLLIGVVTYFFGILRALGAVAMGAVILYLGFSYFRSAGQSPPDETPDDVRDEGLKYVCTMCGLELRVEVAASDRPPTHCREKMVLVRAGEHPPLRPV